MIKKLKQSLSKARFSFFLVIILFMIFGYSIARLQDYLKIRISKASELKLEKDKQNQSAKIFAQINPAKGYQINAKYGDIGPKMIKAGVIDLQKFKSVYEKSGQPLSKEQLQILTKGSDKKININSENSYFLLNFFWAFGLANKTKILTEGDMVKYGEGKVGNFASTGGWSNMTQSGDAMNYYSANALVPLTKEKEDLVNSVASNVYRPCCDNSTAFPDCNHGMALLGIFELMAAQGAGESEMYQAAKYINSFWFPANVYDVAMYFKSKEGKDFKNIDAKTFLSKDIFSASGAQNVKKYLVGKGIQEKPSTQGGGCGV